MRGRQEGRGEVRENGRKREGQSGTRRDAKRKMEPGTEGGAGDKAGAGDRGRTQREGEGGQGETKSGQDKENACSHEGQKSESEGQKVERERKLGRGIEGGHRKREKADNEKGRALQTRKMHVAMRDKKSENKMQRAEGKGNAAPEKATSRYPPSSILLEVFTSCDCEALDVFAVVLAVRWFVVSIVSSPSV